MSSTSKQRRKNDQVVIESNDDKIEELSVEDECKRRPHLDGTWFLPNLTTSTVKKVFASCQLCRKRHNQETVISGPVYSLSNFKTHLKWKHKDDVEGFDYYCVTKRGELKKESDDARRKTYCNFSQKRTDENIVNFVADTFAPYNIVENKSFRKIFDDMEIKQGNKSFKHMSTRTLVRHMDDSFQSKMAEIKEKISAAKHVSTTADIWTSRHRRFMGVTAHWLDPITLKGVSYAIACQRFPGSHTHDKIAQILNGIHSKYQLTKDKLTATVTDNGSNFVKAFQAFGVQSNAIDSTEDNAAVSNESEISVEEDLVTVMPFTEIVSPLLSEHRTCASHTYNLLATTDTLKGINSIEPIKLMYNDVISKCNDLWSLLRSPKKYEIIHEVLGVALKRPVPTRWNSLFDAFKQLIELKEKLDTLSITLNLLNPLTSNDFEFLNEYVKCNEPIAIALDKLQGEVDVTYGHLLPTLISTRNKLNKLQEVPLNYCKGLIPVLIASLEKRFQNFFDVTNEGIAAATAAAVHPRFKLKWLHCLGDSARENVLTAVKSGMTSCYKPSPEKSETKPMDIACDDYVFDDGTQDNVIPQNIISTDEVEQQFKTFCDDKNNNLNMLHAYPIIKETFMKFNSVLPSSASVERMFNLATMWNAPRFNRLTNEHFEQRVLFKANKSLY